MRPSPPPAAVVSARIVRSFAAARSFRNIESGSSSSSGSTGALGYGST